MFKEEGVVVELEENHVWVETIRSSSCGSCSAKNACGQRLLNELHSGRCHKIRVPLGEYEQTPAVGDAVSLILPEGELVKGALTLYILPLALLLLGAVLGQQLFAHELPAIAGALLGFVVGLVVVRRSTQHASYQKGMQPHLLVNSGQPAGSK